MVEKAVADLGRLDLLVNNAGTPGTRHRIAPPELDLITEELWSTLLETNLLGVFRCAKAAAPALKQAGGAIVNTASIAGLGRAGSSLAYSATKAGRCQPDAEPRPGAGAGGAGECDCSGRGGQFMDGGMDK